MFPRLTGETDAPTTRLARRTPPGENGDAVRIQFPPALPVSARRDDIAEAIQDHQVVVVAGETGSGKTTQLPKICLALGRGEGGGTLGKEHQSAAGGGAPAPLAHDVSA